MKKNKKSKKVKKLYKCKLGTQYWYSMGIDTTEATNNIWETMDDLQREENSKETIQTLLVEYDIQR